ncbi:MAG: OmpA family protein [Chitinophagales bacterium]
MKKGFTVLVVLLIGWVAISSWWYVCQVKGLCHVNAEKVTQLNDLELNLDGEEKMLFNVSSTKDGMITFQNKVAGQSIGAVSAYLNDHPEKNISITSNSDKVIDAILATYKIIGIEEVRVNYNIIGNKKALTKIISIDNPNYVDVQDSIVSDDFLVDNENGTAQNIEANTTDETKNVAPQEWIPCPDVNTRDSYPRIEYILFGSASYTVTCPNAIKMYAEAAIVYLNEVGGKLIVTGHSDIDKRQTNNLSLGLKRASEVKKYLMRYGVPSDKIETYSKGDTEPIGDNETAAGKQLNRRVTIELY